MRLSMRFDCMQPLSHRFRTGFPDFTKGPLEKQTTPAALHPKRVRFSMSLAESISSPSAVEMLLSYHRLLRVVEEACPLVLDEHSTASLLDLILDRTSNSRPPSSLRWHARSGAAEDSRRPHLIQFGAARSSRLMGSIKADLPAGSPPAPCLRLPIVDRAFRSNLERVDEHRWKDPRVYSAGGS
jgi:hypothetical protein